MSVTLQPAAPSDRDFLSALYASTREEELAGVVWSEEEREQFLSFQFTIRQAAYQAQYAGAQDQVILVDGQRAGRLLVCRAPASIYLVDIALLPAYRGRSIGSELVRGLQAEGKRSGQPVRLQVTLDNVRARQWYVRLGFTPRSQTDPYIEMEWQPPAQSETDSQ